jgi:hypothetical protein
LRSAVTPCRRSARLRASAAPFSVATNSIRWIHSNLEHFNPFVPSTIPEDLRHKAFAELVLLCLILRRHERFASLSEIRDIMAFASRLHTNPFFEASIGRWNDALVPVLILAVALEAYGLGANTERRKMIERVIRDSNVCIIERVPFRQLELRHILDLGGFAHRLPSYRDLWSRTLLANKPNIALLSDDDVYSITHVLFYLSDFSAQKIEFLLPSEIDGIHHLISHLLGVFIRRRNWDLTAELLAAERCLARISRRSIIGWRHLVQAQFGDGRMEGPQMEKLDADVGDPEKIFSACYHTTLVSALAGGLSVARG